MLKLKTNFLGAMPQLPCWGGAKAPLPKPYPLGTPGLHSGAVGLPRLARGLNRPQCLLSVHATGNTDIADTTGLPSIQEITDSRRLALFRHVVLLNARIAADQALKLSAATRSGH